MAEENTVELEEWTEFKRSFNKSYEAEEDEKRMKIFLESKRTVEEHNQKFERGETTYKMGLNEFSDWLPEERQRLTGLRAPNALDGKSPDN